MSKIKLILLLIVFNNYWSVSAEWKMINLIHWGVYTNVDSLKSISLSDKSKEAATIEFKMDSTYTLRVTKNNKIKNGYYFLDKGTCELILNKSMKHLKNIKYRERSDWAILYLDNETLIYKEDNNPKSVATHVLIRK